MNSDGNEYDADDKSHTGPDATENAVAGVNTFTYNGGTLDLITSAIENQTFNSLVLTNDLDYTIDINLTNGTADTLTALALTTNNKAINLSNINWLGSNESMSNLKIALNGANSTLADAITLGVTSYSTGNQANDGRFFR